LSRESFIRGRLLELNFVVYPKKTTTGRMFENEFRSLSSELKGILEERERLKESVSKVVDVFIVESSVDGRMICFEFHDSDVKDLKEQLKKVFS
jgi:hypothetical protein